MQHNLQQAVEISSFRVVEGTSEEAVLGAATTLNPTLKDLGMVSRTLSHDKANQTWVDIIVWESSEKAKAAPEIIMRREDAGAFFKLMIPESVTMQHLNVMSSQ